MTITDIHCHVNWLDMDIGAWVAHFRSLGVSRVWALGREQGPQSAT
jgi:hypothetical protein